MASVDLDKLWLHLVEAPDTYLSFYLDSEVEELTAPVEARRYAGGRVRMIVRAGTQQRLGLRLEQLPRAEVNALREWVGLELLLREPRGRLMVGFFDSFEVDEVAPVDLAHVSLTFQQITSSLPAV